MSKREAVPKHSLPPQKQILSYMGRFINCPYAPDTEPGDVSLSAVQYGVQILLGMGDGLQLIGIHQRLDHRL